MRRLALGFILLGMLFPTISLGLGLGEIQVDSALNQPLDARIELLGAKPDDVEVIQARLAAPEVFDRVGIPRPYYLTELKFTPSVVDGKTVIAVTTHQRVREPFLNFLVEVTWPNGRLLREYTVLLDPPLFMEGQAAPATQAPATAAPAPSGATAPMPSAPRPTPTPPVAAPVPQPAGETETYSAAAPAYPAETPRPDYAVAGPQSIEVQRGDTLWGLSRELRPDGVSVNQMMMALLRTNPEAFKDNNINNLKRGYVLRMPGREEMQAMTTAEATASVREQNALWREYRAQFAGQTVSQQATTEAAEQMPADVMAETPAEMATSGQVELLGTGDGLAGEPVEGATPEQLQGELALVKQTLEARRQENQELRDRIGELEGIIDDKDRLIELKNEQLAQVQGGVSGEPPLPTTEGEPLPAPMEPVAEPETAEPMAEAPEAMAEMPAAEGMTEEGADTGMPETAMPEEGMSAEESPMEPVESAEQAVTPEPMPEEEPAPVAEPELATPSEPEMQPSFVEDLLASPNMLMIVGFGGLLILALIWLVVRRLAKRGQAAMESEPSFAAAGMGAGATATAGAFDAPTQVDEKPAVESKSEVPAFEDEAPDLEAVGDEGEIESDDTTAEADVYLAYGLHQQAEDLLKGALADRPEKDVYRLKLLETHFATKNKAAFDDTAAELQGRVNGQGPMWDRAVAMGKELSPDNPLFSGVASGLSVADFAPKKPDESEIDIDLGFDEPSTSTSAADLDIGLDEPMAGETSQSADALGLDFDLDVSESAGLDDLELSTATSGAPEAEETDEFGLAFDEPTAETPEVTPSASPVDETAEVEFDLSDFEAGEEPTAVVEHRSEQEDSTDINFNVDASDFELDDTEESPAGQVELASTDDTMELEVGDLGELGSAFGDNEPTDFNQQLDESELLPNADEDELISGGDEVGTKLDLAKAYIDMGDAEGARSTLEEVIAEGNEQQRREAQDLMNQIA